jgi:RNA polymerase-binding transcription factor DksA
MADTTLESRVNSLLMPTPDRPRPDLVASLPALRARLEEQRQFRLEQLAALAEPTLDADGHREVAEVLAAGARQALADIETALERIGTGRYGTCLRCGAPIPLERLDIIPETGLCVDCQRSTTAGR